MRKKANISNKRIARKNQNSRKRATKAKKTLPLSYLQKRIRGIIQVNDAVQPVKNIYTNCAQPNSI
jgi:hypothetical protein